jgi:hypothetical protein
MAENSGPAKPVRVVVTDVDIHFSTLVWLMVKTVLAAVPALLILGVFGVFLTAVFLAVFGGK